MASDDIGSSSSEADFSSCDLVSIPDSLRDAGFCSLLRELFLDYNSIVDLPSAMFDDLHELRVFSAVGNELAQLPDAVGKMLNLEKFFIQENRLSSLPESIGNLCRLQELNVVGNQVQCIPDCISDASSLREIYLDENRLQHLPDSIVKLTNLERLEVCDNMLASLPEDIGNLLALKVLNVSGNQLEGALPESLGDLTNVCEMDLSHNQVSELPSKCRFQKTLLKLFAERNVLQSLPDWVNHLPNIKHLSFRDNVLRRQPFAEQFGRSSTQLRVFDISGNFISRLPESIGNLRKLEKFRIGSVICELERRNFQNGNWIASLPIRFSQMEMLKEAYLDENQISELPDDFGCLVNLEFIDLGQNQLRRLPDSFCKLRSLKVCQLSKNLLESLPENLGEMKSLIDLRLDNNQLKALPASLGELTQLQSLDLFHNLFTVMPSCLSQLTNLVRLDVYENNFEMKWWEVPCIHTRAKYAAKTTASTDNWRGKFRADHSEVKVKEMEPTGEERVEEEEEKLNWRQDTLRDAAMRNMSLWKSHSGGGKERQKFFHKKNKENDDDNEDDDWECPEVGQDSVPLPPLIDDSQPAIVYSESPPSHDDAFFPDGENWEDEIKQPRLLDPLANGMLSVHVPQRPTFGLPVEHIFIPGDSHVGHFQRTSKVNPIFASKSQFDDAN